jgi:hypothetical protein
LHVRTILGRADGVRDRADTQALGLLDELVELDVQLT